MLIQFSRDYRGKLTQEIFYTAGTIADLDSGCAMQIIAEGAAVAVEQPTEQPAEDAPKPKRKRKPAAEG
jgi:hypothetical protein